MIHLNWGLNSHSPEFTNMCNIFNESNSRSREPVRIIFGDIVSQALRGDYAAVRNILKDKERRKNGTFSWGNDARFCEQFDDDFPRDMTKVFTPQNRILFCPNVRIVSLGETGREQQRFRVT